MNTSNAIVLGSLGDIAARDGMSLAESFINADAMILVDCSASMDAPDSRGGRRRFDVALEELATLQAHMPGKIAVIAFSGSVQFVPGGQPPFFGGSTNLAEALRFAKVADIPGMRFVVISDGEPDDAKGALAVAATYQNRIDTVFVGPEMHPSGRRFLEQLATAKGGQSVTADRAQELAAKTEQILLNA
jgi:hypothetical protein